MKRDLRKNPGSGKEKKQQLEKLKKYRKVQAALAISRDLAYCVRCYWSGRIKDYEHVHHTEGRGTYEKEHYTKLLCLCVDCHRLFSTMRVKLKTFHAAQRALVDLANENPINTNFEHNFDEQD